MIINLNLKKEIKIKNNFDKFFKCFIYFLIVNNKDIQTLIMNGLLVTGDERIYSFFDHILIEISSVLSETGNIENYLNSEIIDAKKK